MRQANVTAIAAQKGGTGKTALAGSLAALWALTGARILAIDLDQQANLSYAFAVDPPTLDATVVDVLALRNSTPPADAIVHGIHGIGTLDLLPCDERAESLDIQLRSEAMGTFRLRDVMEPVFEKYDHVFIDCPPNVGELTVSALLCADDIVCPVRMSDTNALRGLSRLTQTIGKLNRQNVPVTLRSLAKIGTDPRQNSYQLNAEKLTQLSQSLNLPVAASELRQRAAWQTAVTQDVPLVLLEESDDSTRDAQADVHTLACELWPEVPFPFPSEIRSRRRANPVQEVA